MGEGMWTHTDNKEYTNETFDKVKAGEREISTMLSDLQS